MADNLLGIQVQLVIDADSYAIDQYVMAKEPILSILWVCTDVFEMHFVPEL